MTEHATFEIETDPQQQLVTATLRGFFRVADVVAFSVHEQQLIRGSDLAGGFLLLVDTSAMMLQSQEVVAAFMRIIASSPLRARRIAVVTGSSLSRMQLRRVLAVRDDARTFFARDDALRWLLAGAAVDAGRRAMRA